MLLITIDEDIYDVKKFEQIHPGEGINNIYLKNFHRKDASVLFDRYHYSKNEPIEILMNAKKHGNYNNVDYVCPNFFRKNIPKYFYFSSDDLYATNFMKNISDNSFVLRRSNSDTNNSMSITYKQYSNIYQLKVRRGIDNIWFCDWKDKSKPVTIYGKDIEEIVEKVMISNSFIPIDTN